MLPRPFGVLRLYSRCSVQLCPHHRALKPRSPPHPKRFPHGRRTGLCRGEVVGLVPPHQGCSERGLTCQSGAEIPASRFGLSWGGTKPKAVCITNRPKAKQFVWGQAYMFGFASAFCFTFENKRPKGSFSCSHGQVLFLPDDTAL